MDRLRRSALSLGLLIALLGLATGPVLATPQETITVASTTSTEQSGLFKDLLPKFTLASGIAVKVVALGTGQALDAARRGDADVALVHDTTAEEKFVSEGWSTKRYPVMYNDFVIVGPKDDPAGAAGASVRRGPAQDRRRQGNPSSLAVIARAPIPPSCATGTKPVSISARYAAIGTRIVGQGMGPALNTASASNAYLLTDRGTWLSFKNRGDLKILVEGDKRLFNQYGVMLVNPEKHPHVKAKAGTGLHRLARFHPGAERHRCIPDRGGTTLLP